MHSNNNGLDHIFHELSGYEGRREKGSAVRERYQEALTKAFGETLNTEAGALVLYHILDQTGYFRISFTGNSHTFFNEGQRSVGHEIYNQLVMADKEIFAKLDRLRKNLEENFK